VTAPLPDYERRDLSEPRAHVSPVQLRAILEWDEDDAMKAEALDALEMLNGDEFLGIIRQTLESGLACQGLARDAHGIWRDAMVQDPDGSWRYDPESLAA